MVDAAVGRGTADAPGRGIADVAGKGMGVPLRGTEEGGDVRHHMNRMPAKTAG